ncbi:16858_t:CDS:1 [Racocetra persica]|uniref:16858_t:CDS:1 n=1 Tax=Racocetra persica TaxID=160502 RepID=A0ACA9S2Y2_9GLOM|nr:16858_t:CDS:1 [Racocetra persica]
MKEMCEVIPSNKGGDKINVHGFLMTKESCRNHIYYWCCDQRKSEDKSCLGHAITYLYNNTHYLQKASEHNHAPELYKAEVAKVKNQIKKQAKETRDKPIKIVQDNVINTLEEFRPYLSSLNTLRKTINHVRQVESSPQPQSIVELNMPESL